MSSMALNGLMTASASYNPLVMSLNSRSSSNDEG